jgi:hypothetical protein
MARLPARDWDAEISTVHSTEASGHIVVRTAAPMVHRAPPDRASDRVLRAAVTTIRGGTLRKIPLAHRLVHKVRTKPSDLLLLSAPLGG